MSVWKDIYRRSSGEDLSKEDFNEIYYGDKENKELFRGEYKSSNYTIYTNGEHPWINVYMSIPISGLAGNDRIQIDGKDDDKKNYTLTRLWDSGKAVYIYTCNCDDDFIYGKQEGKKYSLETLKSMAEWFIDEIDRFERNFQDYCSKHD